MAVKDVFVASFCQNGVLGGAIYLKSDKAIYRTNKATADKKCRNLEMFYRDMAEIQTGHLLFFPTVAIRFKDETSHKFIVFARKKFLDRMDELKRQIPVRRAETIPGNDLACADLRKGYEKQ